MEIFAQEMCYQRGDLVHPTRDEWETPRLCVAITRRFFDLPIKAKMSAAQVGRHAQYVLSVHDKYKKNGVAIRITPSTLKKKDSGWWGSDERKVQIERSDENGHIGWTNIRFYEISEVVTLKLFDESKKELLYVVIEAV